MEFWFTLNNLWTSTLLPAFLSIIDFFETSIGDLFTYNLPDSPTLVQSALGALLNGFRELLSLLGINLTLPLWQFLLVNIGVILVVLIAVQFLSLVRG